MKITKHTLRFLDGGTGKLRDIGAVNSQAYNWMKMSLRGGVGPFASPAA